MRNFYDLPDPRLMPSFEDLFPRQRSPDPEPKERSSYEEADVSDDDALVDRGSDMYDD